MLFDETTAGGENAFLNPVSYVIGGVSALGEAGMAMEGLISALPRSSQGL